MAVVNGEDVEATLVNSRFVSRTQDSTTVGRLGLQNTSDPLSGPSLGNAQQAINEAFDAVGISSENDLTRNDYSSNNVVSNGDNRKVAVGKLDATFDGTTGHVHDGTAGNGPKVDASNLDNINLLFAEWQTGNVPGVTGSSTDVSVGFTGKTPNGSPSAMGVITTAPYNKVALFEALTLQQFEDAEGQKVFGRLTESAGVWTLSYFTNEAGVETAYSFATSVDMKVYFIEVFDQFTRPTIPSGPEFGSLDLSADVVDATSTQRGLVSTNTQSFGGDKTFDGLVNADNGLNVFGEATIDGWLKFPSQDDTGIGPGHIVALGSFIRLTGVGLTQIEGLFGSPDNSLKFVLNKTGGSVVIVHESGLAGANEKIQVATGTNYTLKQNQGAFFVYDASSMRWVLLSVSEATLSVGAVLGSFNSNGAVFNPASGVFQLAPAGNTFPGIVTAGVQEFSGVKTFKDSISLDGNDIIDVSTITGTLPGGLDLDNVNVISSKLAPTSFLSLKGIAPNGGAWLSADPADVYGYWADVDGASYINFDSARIDFKGDAVVGRFKITATQIYLDSATIRLPQATASKPLKTNGTKDIISSEIDLTGGAGEITGVLDIANGGTGEITAVDALNALLPDQTGNATKVLTTDGTNATWQTGGGGGGSGTPSFIPVLFRDYITGPQKIEDTVSNLYVSEFIPNGDQFLKALIVVPPNYTPGKQIKLIFPWYSYESGIGSIVFSSIVSLFGGATPLIGAPTDSDSYSTGTLPITQNAIITQELNLTNALGVIGSTAVQPNDKLVILFKRDSDASVENVYVAHESAGGFIVP